MKILLTTHQFFPEYSAGTEVLTYSVARELLKRGHMVHILTGYPGSADLGEDDRFDEYDFEGIHVYRFHHAYTPMAGQTSMIEVGYDNRLATRYFEQILQKFKPDIVHFLHLNRLGTGLIDAAVNACIPAFMTPTDFWVVCPTGQLVLADGKLCSGPSAHAGNCVKHFACSTQKGLLGNVAQLLPSVSMDLLVRLTQAEVMPPYPHQVEVRAIASRLPINIARLNKLKKIISPNSFMTEKLLQYGVLPNVIVQSAFGIDVSAQAAEETLHRSARQVLRVGFIGTLAPHKGCHTLINAFKALPEGSAVLNIYGKTDELPEYSAELKRLAENNDSIKFCGTFHNSKIGEVLAALDVLVVPSLWYENTPLVIYSAQAAKCPVVASDYPGISEVIQDQVNGLLFEAGNTKDLSDQLYRLIDESGLLTKLSLNCKRPKSTLTYVDELLRFWQLDNG